MAADFPSGPHLESLLTPPANTAYLVLEWVLISEEVDFSIAQQPQAFLMTEYGVLVLTKFLVT